jgi:hypothetical protein
VIRDPEGRTACARAGQSAGNSFESPRHQDTKETKVHGKSKLLIWFQSKKDSLGALGVLVMDFYFHKIV